MWTGVRVFVVSTSLTSSSSSPTIHCARCGPASADRKVRGCPCLSRLRTGAAMSGRTGEAHEGEDGGEGHGWGEGREGPRPTMAGLGLTGSAPPAEPKTCWGRRGAPADPTGGERGAREGDAPAEPRAGGGRGAPADSARWCGAGRGVRVPGGKGRGTPADLACTTDAGKNDAGEAKEGETKRDGDAEKKEERRLVGERKFGEGKKVGEDENRKLGEDEK